MLIVNINLLNYTKFILQNILKCYEVEARMDRKYNKITNSEYICIWDSLCTPKIDDLHLCPVWQFVRQEFHHTRDKSLHNSILIEYLIYVLSLWLHLDWLKVVKR